MKISFEKNVLHVDSKIYELKWPILDVKNIKDTIIVLFDPDSYLLDPEYKKSRQQGAAPIKNLVAFTQAGEKLWEAEFPERERGDYYYQISSTSPLTAATFSSYSCEIDPSNGKIIRKEFYK
jgi:hypothetical protein